MTALTQNQSTPLRAGEIVNARIGASTTIYQGALLEIAATGYCSGATKGAGKTYWGIALEPAATGAGETATITAHHRACAHFKGDATLDTDAEKLAALGDKAYVVDDQTVSLTAAGASAAGVIVDYDDGGVWVTLDT